MEGHGEPQWVAQKQGGVWRLVKEGQGIWLVEDG